MGDFNELLTHEDKRGGRPYPQRLISEFQEVVAECELNSLNLEGSHFMWERSRGFPRWIQEKLDYVFATDAFLQIFSQLRARNLPTVSSVTLVFRYLRLLAFQEFLKGFSLRVHGFICRSVKTLLKSQSHGNRWVRWPYLKSWPVALVS